MTERLRLNCLINLCDYPIKQIMKHPHKTTQLQTIFCFLLGATLLLVGIGHLTWQRVEFQAQVPPWVPMDQDLVVVVSGIFEIGLGLSLIFFRRYRVAIGWITAVFFILIFPGNISQYVNQIDAFGLNSDLSRFIRLFFQPALVIWALWSTGAWQTWRNVKSGRPTGE